MPLLPSASEVVPVLILTDEDYQKAFAPEVPPAVAALPSRAAKPRPEPVASPLPEPELVAETPAFRNLPVPEKESRVLPALAAAAVVAVLIAGSVLAWLEFKPEPAATPVVAVAPRKPVVPAPKPEPPRPLERPVAAPVAVDFPSDPPPAEEKPAQPAKAERAAPWNGGRAWVEVCLHMEYKGTVQDLRRKVVVVWDGSQFVVERPVVGRPEAWLQRLELLLQWSQVGDSWPRTISKVSKDRVACSGETYSAERVEGEDRFPEETRRFTYWTAPEFGAGAIRAAVTFPDVRLEFQVLAFGAEPESSRKP